METWEVVVILALTTFAVTIIANHHIPSSIIAILDNSIFQLAILGATLGVAAVSPAVAIVAIATIVIVFYIRNLIKIQLVSEKQLENVERVGSSEPTDVDSPRLEVVEETTVVQTESVEVTQVHLPDASGAKVPVSMQTLPVLAAGNPHQADNKDVVAAALQEHESHRPPTEDIGTRSNLKGNNQIIKDEKPPVNEKFDNPRGDGTEGFEVESMDVQAEFHAPAPPSSGRLMIPVDSDVFTPAAAQVDGSNEILAAPAVRTFADSAGQYSINEIRPSTVAAAKYETADYMPSTELGTNAFSPVGVSIDDKITMLKKGVMPSTAPPPNFNNAVPTRSTLSA
jgi:uncharacterized membrane protein YciS (DUF1049 family)